jgi:hypothetical protein
MIVVKLEEREREGGVYDVRNTQWFFFVLQRDDRLFFLGLMSTLLYP